MGVDACNLLLCRTLVELELGNLVFAFADGWLIGQDWQEPALRLRPFTAEASNSGLGHSRQKPATQA